MRWVLKRFGLTSLVVAELVLFCVAWAAGPTQLALPGGGPAPVVLVVLAGAAMIAAAPLAVGLTDAERQAPRGGLGVRVVALSIGALLLIASLALVRVARVDAHPAVVWVAVLWAVGVLAARQWGSTYWLAIAAPGLVGFLMAGRRSSGGDSWLLSALSSVEAAVVGAGLVLVAAAVATSRDGPPG